MADRLFIGSVTMRTGCRHGATSHQLLLLPEQPGVDLALLAATSAMILLARNGVSASEASLLKLIIQAVQRSRDGHLY